MEKLLHERLRKHEDVRLGGGCALSTICGTECSKQNGCEYCIIHSLNALADEIERNYVPIPRLKNGDLIRRRKPYWSTGDGRCWHVIGFRRGDHSVIAVDDAGIRRELKPEWLTDHKPQPKVLDADGVEIKVGDTVWFLYGDRHKFIVDRVYYDNSLGWLVCDGADDERYFAPIKLTHKEPDSLPKVLADMRADNRVRGMDYINRLSALIERGA